VHRQESIWALLDGLGEVFGGITVEEIAEGDDIMGVGFGTDRQRQSGGRGGTYGPVPDGTYPVTLQWRIHEWPNSQYDNNTPALEICISGEGKLETIKVSDADGIELNEDESEILSAPDGWGPVQVLKGSCILRTIQTAYEKSGRAWSDNLHDFAGTVVEVEREVLAGSKAKDPTYPRVLSVTGSDAAVAGDAQGVPEDRLTPAPDPNDALAVAHAKEAISALATDAKADIDMGAIDVASLAQSLPSDCVGPAKLRAVKLMKSPAFLATEDGWLYDKKEHRLLLIPF